MNPPRAAVRRVLSWKRFALVAGVFAVLAAGAYGVHRAQERRNADALKDQAAQAAADPDRRDTALTLYERYLRFRPKDEEAYRDYVKLATAPAKDEPAQYKAAADTLETFVRKFPNNPEERKRLIDLYMKLAKTQLAKQHLETLFHSDEKYRADPDLRDKAATCEVADGKPAAAIDHLKKAIETNRAPVGVYRRLIWLYWENRQAIRDAETAANDLARLLIETDPFRTNPEARVVAADYRMLRKDMASADEQIKKALAMPGGAENAEVLLAAARYEIESRTPADAKARLAAARDYLERARRANPSNTRVALRLAEIVLIQGKPDEARQVLVTAADALDKPNDLYLRVVDQLIDLGERERSARLTDALAKDPNMRNIVAYYRGRLATLAGDWIAARDLLTAAADAFGTRADLKEYRKKLHADLGRCYQALQNPDRQLQHHQLALDDDQGYVPAVIGKADALAKLGELEKALPLYRTLVSDKGYGLSQFRPTLARLELLAALKTPEEDRKWGSFTDALGPPETRTAELELLRAEALAVQGNAAEAAKVIDAVLAKVPDYPNAWLALVRLKYHGRSEPALAELDAVQKKAGDSPERRLTRGMLLAGRSSRRPTADEFRKLADGVEQFPRPSHYRLWVGLGEAAIWAANAHPDAAAAKQLRAVAVDFYRKAAAAEPNDLPCRAVLIDLGSATDDRAVVDQALAEIARIEGPDGPLANLGRIAVELPTAANDPEKIRELRARAERVRAERQGWSRVYVALAKLDQMALKTDSALTNYRLAIRTGDRSEEVIRRTVELLRERKKDVEAAHLLNDVYTQVPLPDDLERFRAVMNLLSKDVPTMERTVIDKIAPPREKGRVRKDEHKLLLLRGTLLASIRADAEAEEAYRDALALEDNIPETWTAVIVHLGRTGKTAEAKKILTKAEEKLKTRPPADPVARAKLIVALAGGYEIVGDLKAAEERYATAVKAAPKDLGTNRQLVGFYQRSGNTKEADALLLALSADPAPELHRWAKRHRALTLVSRQDAYEQRKTALDLIAQNLATGPADSEDRKARAIVLTLDPETRKEGMDTLREYAERSELTPDEYALLGRLYFDRGDLDLAVVYFRQAAQPGPGQTPEHLALLVRAELARNQLVRAERAADRLRILAPATWEAARETAVVLARKAKATGDQEDSAKLAARAKELVLKFPATAENPVFAASAAAPLLDEIGATADAEALYRKVLDANTGSHLPLAVFLIQQKRAGEAVDLAFKYADKAPVVVTARVLSGAARDLGPADAAKAAEVERWLDAKLEQYKGKPEYGLLVGARAELLDARGRYDEAIAEYRRAILLTPEGRTSIAVNNLCMLIALREPGRVGEAIELMNHLIGVRGPGPSFLDTRAVCYLVAGGTYRDAAKNKTGPELALADLELALVQKQSAVYRFHKAWAYHLLGKQAERDIALGEAKAGKLTPAQLHPLERDKLRELYVGFPGGPPE